MGFDKKYWDSVGTGMDFVGKIIGAKGILATTLTLIISVPLYLIGRAVKAVER